MGTLSDRLQWITEHRGISARALSLAAGMSQSYVGQVIRGDIKGNVPVEVLRSIASAAPVDAHWLMTGDGSPDDEAAVTRLELDEDPVVEEALRTMGATDAEGADMRATNWRVLSANYDVDFVCDVLRRRRLQEKMRGVSHGGPQPVETTLRDGMIRRPSRGGK